MLVLSVRDAGGKVFSRPHGVTPVLDSDVFFWGRLIVTGATDAGMKGRRPRHLRPRLLRSLPLGDAVMMMMMTFIVSYPKGRRQCMDAK